MTNPRNPLPSKTSIFGGISSKRIRTTEGSCASREHASFHRPRKDLFDFVRLQSRFSVSADDVRGWQREKMVKPHGGFKPFGALLFLVEQVDFRKPSQQFRSSLGLALARASSFWFRNKRNFHLRRQFIWYTSVPAPLSVSNTTAAFLLVLEPYFSSVS